MRLRGDDDVRFDSLSGELGQGGCRLLARVPNAGDGSLNLTNLFSFFYSVSCSRYVLASKCQVAFDLISLRTRVLQQNTVVGRWREPEENNYPAVRRSRSGIAMLAAAGTTLKREAGGQTRSR